MSSSLLAFTTNQIKVKQGAVTFEGYEDLKHQASLLAEEINNVEVTEENVKTSKKMLAAVNKRVKEIEDKRISIKKEMLQPYTEFESQVKDIVNIVKDADRTVRQQVKDLEEMERAEKERTITEIFNKRLKHYDILEGIYKAEDFITPQHLNKSKSLNSIETEMVEWLEKKESDLKVIQSLPNASRVLTEYLDTKDLSVAMNIVSEYDKRINESEKKVTSNKQYTPKEYIIKLTDEKDFKLIEMYMNQNNIKFEKVVK